MRLKAAPSRSGLAIIAGSATAVANYRSLNIIPGMEDGHVISRLCPCSFLSHHANCVASSFHPEYSQYQTCLFCFSTPYYARLLSLLRSLWNTTTGDDEALCEGKRDGW